MEGKYVCYCFKYTKEAIEEDVKTKGESTIMARIINESKAGHCNCKINNPKGK